MKYTQNEKIMQISEEILVVGVDIASEIHYARALKYAPEVVEILKRNGHWG